jgi:ubiquinone biosynthesis protein Coq4
LRDAMPDERDQEIAALHDALLAKAKEELEVEGKQREVLEDHGIPSRDQLEKELTERAYILGVYWRQMLANGIDPDSAMWLLRDEADFQRECG